MKSSHVNLSVKPKKYLENALNKNKNKNLKINGPSERTFY